MRHNGIANVKYDAELNILVRDVNGRAYPIGNGAKGDKGDKGDKGADGIVSVNFHDLPINYDFVVDTNIIAWQPTPNPWWKQYRSGFIEQGGVVETNNDNSSSVSVALTKEMADDQYCLNIFAVSQYSNWPKVYSGSENANQRGTRSFVFIKDYANKFSWEVKGMGKSSD